MTFDDFQKSVHEHFSTNLPDKSRLFEGIRVESGHERLECLQSVEWPEFSQEIIDFVAGEYWQLSTHWIKCYLPSVMLLTAKAELELNEYYELKDELDALTTICFSYWFDLMRFRDNQFEASQSVFSELKSAQIDIVEYWLNHIEFQVLDKASELPDGFDYSNKALKALTNKMHEFALK